MATNYTGNGDASPSSIQDAFIQAYTAGYELILQEMKPLYEGKMRMEALKGEAQSYDFMGSIDMNEVTDRGADLNLVDMATNRRWISPKFFRTDAILINQYENVYEHLDPNSDYMRSLAAAVIRQKNAISTDSFFDTVYGGKNRGEATYGASGVYDTKYSNGGAGRVIAHDFGGTSATMTLNKLEYTLEILFNLNNSPDEKVYIAVSPNVMRGLKSQTEMRSIESSDFKSATVAVVDSLGSNIEFIQTPRITLEATGDVDGDAAVYNCPVWTKSGMLFGQSHQPNFTYERRADKDCWQMFATYGANAIRMDEDKVLKIECVAFTD